MNSKMPDIAVLENAIRNNLNWFMNSEIMSPKDGTWGVAERVVNTERNTALADIYKYFPEYTEYEGYSILEHRRADCNFQTAWLFHLAAKIFHDEEYANISNHILNYLFHRSGMMCRRDPRIPVGLWRWSTPQWNPTYWLDDNAWVCILCLLLSNTPELESRYLLKQAGLKIADAFLADIDNFLACTKDDLILKTVWSGEPESPHWGSLVAMALAYAYQADGNEQYRSACLKYMERFHARDVMYTTSEQAYMALATSSIASIFQDEKMISNARRWNDALVDKMNDQGNIASQWRETQEGEHYVDTIYTQNWATLAFGNMKHLTGESRYADAYAASLQLLTRIQDTTPAKHLCGCWRGLYDLESHSWSGGDKYEGGSGSIYSGWTNAPISWAIALELFNSCIAGKRDAQ